MKKILTLFAVVGLFVFSGCSDDDNDVDYDTIGAVYENTSSNYYNFTSQNNYSVGFDFPVNLFDSDVVLVYRFDGTDNAGRPVWQALPETYYLANGTREFSYKFVFTKSYVDIYLDSNNPTAIPSDYRLNQIFRIVVVPADFATTVNKSSYLDVVAKLNLKESQIQEIKL